MKDMLHLFLLKFKALFPKQYSFMVTTISNLLLKDGIKDWVQPFQLLRTENYMVEEELMMDMLPMVQ